MSKQELYLSLDIEADGESPAYNNMLSIGIYGFDEYKNEIWTWQKNLKPRKGKIQEERCMKEFWRKQPEAWAFVTTNQEDPIIAFQELSNELKKLNEIYQLKWIAWPAAYDWQWLKAYYEDMKNALPDFDAFDLGFKATCVSTLWEDYVMVNKLTREQDNDLWNKCSEGLVGNHNSLMDAKVQGIRFYNLQKLKGIF